MLKSKQKRRIGSKSPAQQRDRRRRGSANALTHLDRRQLIEAFEHGRRIGFPLTTTIDFHPLFLDRYPERELSVWFKDELRNRITTWLRRRRVGWYAIWVRENYVGDHREHIHLIIHCPPHLRADLEVAIRCWFPGQRAMVKVGLTSYKKHFYSGRIVCAELEYRLKQMTTKALGPPRLGRPRRETRSSHDGSPVAPVSGLRCGVSRTLDRKARSAWENRHRGPWSTDEVVQQVAVVDVPVQLKAQTATARTPARTASSEDVDRDWDDSQDGISRLHGLINGVPLIEQVLDRLLPDPLKRLRSRYKTG